MQKPECSRCKPYTELKKKRRKESGGRIYSKIYQNIFPILLKNNKKLCHCISSDNELAPNQDQASFKQLRILRFDKSKIHSWGIYTDEFITKGEYIVEYKGEIIPKSMQEQRDKQYEIEELGSDYISFRKYY